MEDDVIYSFKNLLIANDSNTNRLNGNVNMDENISLSNCINRDECRSIDVSSPVQFCCSLPQLPQDSNVDMMNEQTRTEEVPQKRVYKRRRKSNALEGGGKRKMPGRACKEMKELGIMQSTIKKVKKKENTRNKISDIKKNYITKALMKFPSTKLETIFEESHSVRNQNDDEQYKPMIGSFKVKRILACSAGVNYTKTTIKKRRKHIKKAFGINYKKNKTKISDREFLERLKNVHIEDDAIEDPSNLTHMN